MAKKILSSYLFAGPEAGEKRRRIETLAGEWGKAKKEELERFRFYPYETPMADILSLLRNGSLFSSQKLVVIGDVDTLKKGDRKTLGEYLAKPAQGVVLVLTTDKTPGTREYPKDLAGILPKEAVTIFWEMFERDKRGWLIRFLKERGLKPLPAAVDLLLDRTEGTTDALREACEVLAFSVTAGEMIREEDVDKALEHTKEETVYTIFDRFCRRDLEGGINAFRAMAQGDAEGAGQLLTRFADPLIKLKDYTALRKKRISSDDALRHLHIRGGKRAQRNYEAGAGRYQWQELSRAVKLLAETEAWLRSAPREARLPKIEFWLCQIMGRPS